jgi:thiol-disulfide isomerase/thioredoxin
MKIYKIILLLILLSKITIAQEDDQALLKKQQEYKMAGFQEIPYGPQPEVGKPMPDFTLTDVTHYKLKNATVSDFKGKWLFLDFWFKNCGACIASFPKMNEFQKKFADRAQFMLVAKVSEKPGSWIPRKSTEAVYETLRKTKNLELPCAYDTVFAAKWGIFAMPYVIVVNPEGVVKAITSSVGMTAEKIETLLNGGNPTLKKMDVEKHEFFAGIDNKNPKSTDTLVMVQSILLKSKSDENFSSPPIDHQLNNPAFIRKGYKVAVMAEKSLYMTAYFGTSNWLGQFTHPLYNIAYPYPIIETKDTNSFKEDNITKDGFYNYSLDVPSQKANKLDMMKIMQRDLENNFDHKVSIETRKMPIIKLIALPGALNKLKSKSKTYSMNWPDGNSLLGFDATRLKMSFFLFQVMIPIVGQFKNIPFFDETGIQDRIDISYKPNDVSNIEDVRKELQRHGLDLVKGEKEFKVLVIRDKNKSGSKEFVNPDLLINPILALKHVDSVAINEILKKNIGTAITKPDWVTLENSIKKQYPLVAKQIVSQTKTDYYLARKDILNFEKASMTYMDNYSHTIPFNKVKSYKEFIFLNSTNEDLLYDAYKWNIGDFNDISDWYSGANYMYKLGCIVNKNGSTDWGKYYISSAIQWMNHNVLKADPDNKLYQETLAKMEKGESTW